jgi:SOS-response transcriptional repressor LexA
MNDKQQKILDFVMENDISKLSYREIAKRLKLSSPQIVIHHLNQLRKKGLIYQDKDKNVKVAKFKSSSVDNLFRIPIVGAANCGPAMELAQESITGFLTISQRILNKSNGKDLIAVKAVGSSLNKAKIFGNNVDDGDYLIVDCSKRQPEDGEYVLSVMDGAANFKKFFKDDKTKEIRLVSESTLNIPPIILHEDDLETSGYLVNGVVIKVVKN